MTPVPPASPEGGDLPPRHRLNLGNLAKDTTESDLWAFDDLDPDDEPAVKSPTAGTPLIPRPRDLEKSKPRPSPSTGQGNQDSVSVSVNKVRPKPQSGTLSGQSKPGREFDDLDHWDESEPITPATVLPTPAAEPTASSPIPKAEKITPAATESPARDEVPPPRAATAAARPGWAISKVEKVGLALLAILLLAGGVAVYLNTVSRLPTDKSRITAKDFPIHGKFATVDSAVSYWRAPVAADAVQRGTQLIPEILLTTSGGTGAVRVFFRNSDGEVVGDPVTRLAKAGAPIRIAATAGFDDVGMHAAYRTDKKHPWTFEVHEAPSENSSGPEFHKLFEMNISPDRH